MTTLTFSPADGAYDISPTSPIVLIGSAPGHVFDLTTLAVQIDGDPACVGGVGVRPGYAADLTSVPGAFSMVLTRRRASLYRVKVTATASVHLDGVPVTGSATFEIRAPSASVFVGRLRQALNASPPDFSGLVAVASVERQLRSLFGGATYGEFSFRLLRRLYLSQLWSAGHPITLPSGIDDAMANVSSEDAALTGDLTGTLALIDLFWDPARDQLRVLGVSPSFLDLLDRSYTGANDLERLGAAALLIFVAREVVSTAGTSILSDAVARGVR